GRHKTCSLRLDGRLRIPFRSPQINRLEHPCTGRHPKNTPTRNPVRRIDHSAKHNMALKKAEKRTTKGRDIQIPRNPQTHRNVV
ncbi:hypothetical protein, partial [Salmonella enterica]|uniref:hypothetical protein n=1 Tax=Salmonella enterica TaxID=28901 RepID=UPI003298E04C